MHYLGYMGGFGPMWALPFAGAMIVVVAVWSIFWKGLALWHSAQRGEQWWFVALLFINSLGILEIIYLFLVAKVKVDKLFSNHHNHSH